jgi:hypothetical protein
MPASAVARLLRLDPCADGGIHAFWLRGRGGGDMDLNLILLGLVGWALALLGVLVLMRMTSDQDRAARHAEKRLIPHSDVTITHHGNG